MNVSVLFKIRKSKSATVARVVIYCRITVNQVAATDFSTGVRVDEKAWDSKAQRIKGTGRDVAADNQRLNDIRADVLELFNSSKRAGRPYTAAQLRAHYLRPVDAPPTLLECFERVVASRTAKRTTPGAFEKVRVKVGEYLSEKIGRTDLPLTELTDQLLISLQTHWRTEMQNSSVNQIQSYLNAALTWAWDNGFTRKNFGSTLQRLEVVEKELLFLEEPLLNKIREMPYPARAIEQGADCFIAQCFTGLAYSDLKAFKPALHVTTSPRGTRLIQYRRTKTARPFTIPILGPMAALIEKYPDGFPVPPLAEYNNLIRIIGEMAGYPNPGLLTSHVGRKTAGMYLLNNDVQIETVSAILGHTTVRTTQKVYARVMTAKIERNTAHLMRVPERQF